jgi:hypothetical protein
MYYSLNQDRYGQTNSVNCPDKNISIPFDPANTDYQTFKTDISNGAELQDPDGKVMTPNQVSDFIKQLP